jgi:hypothetical protein
MRYLFCILLISLMACKSSPKKTSIYQTLSGNWLVLYLSNDDVSDKKTDLYAKLQDSLVTGKGLKLVTFYADGYFAQLDSLPLKGRWSTKEDEIIYVNGAGKGFDHLKCVFKSYQDGNMLLTETIEAEGQQLDLQWHLLRIDNGDATTLFDKEANTWRNVPVREETEEEMRTRLHSMLKYYAAYFKLLSEESSYFMPSRIMLPMKFYQHAVGIKYYDENSRFVKLFYSPPQAKIAHAMLDGLIERVKFDFPEKKSYTEEYSLMLDQLADELVK